MQNFSFHNPTKIIFGKDSIEKLGREASKQGKRALVLIGMGSVKKNGIYDSALAALHAAEVETVTLEGVKANPILSKVREGIEVVRKENLDMVVAVGGGSVIDSAKAIAAGANYDGDVWDFFIGKAKVRSAKPVLTVLTLAATASEMNGAGVVTNEATQEKFSFGSPYTYPVASIMDPTYTFSVNKEHSAYGGVDSITHLLEPYFNNENPNSALQDGITESLIRTIMQATEAVLHDPNNYDARATIMWSASLALNGLTRSGMGATPFPVHMIEHSLSALYDVPHAAGLSIVMPGWLKYKRVALKGRIAQLGRNVFGIAEVDDAVCAAQTIERLTAWYDHIGSPSNLTKAGIPGEDIPGIAENVMKLANVWNEEEYTLDVVTEILELCN